MCLEHERAPPHFRREKTEFFNKILKEDGLEQMDRWPSVSPNLNPDFFLWGFMQGSVYHGYMQDGSLTITSRNIRYIWTLYFLRHAIICGSVGIAPLFLNLLKPKTYSIYH